MMMTPKEELAEFLEFQTNRALQSTGTIVRSRRITESLGLPLHQDPPKCWDNLLAVGHAAAGHASAAAEGRSDRFEVIDAGAGDGSAFLPGLRKLGLRNLLGNNLDIAYPRAREGVLYEYGDITHMKYSPSCFDFEACLSVIEHGVDVALFLAESARVLKPGGHLFVSTDYWAEKVDAGGRTAFGAPVRVFSEAEMRGLVETAALFGLAPTSEPDYSCGKRTVSWLGLEYTFFNLLLKRSEDNEANG
jgi:SAM-dependent methyltransferase